MNARSLFLSTALAAAMPLTAVVPAPDGPTMSPAGNADGSVPQVLVLPGTKKADAQVAVSSTRVGVGQPIAVRFTVTNNGRKRMRYSFPTGEQFDVAVLNSKGNEVWRWSQGRSFANKLTELSLKPNQSATYTAVWPGVDALKRTVAPGEYALVAQLTPDERPAIAGGIIVNTDTDPNNIGFATEGPVQTGAVRQVTVAAPVAAAVKITVAQ